MTDLGKMGNLGAGQPEPDAGRPAVTSPQPAGSFQKVGLFSAPLEASAFYLAVFLFQMNRRMKAWRPWARWSQFRGALPLYVILICDYLVPPAQNFPCLDISPHRLILPIAQN